jgi:hypothetical protein
MLLEYAAFAYKERILLRKEEKNDITRWSSTRLLIALNSLIDDEASNNSLG